MSIISHKAGRGEKAFQKKHQRNQTKPKKKKVFLTLVLYILTRSFLLLSNLKYHPDTPIFKDLELCKII